MSKKTLFQTTCVSLCLAFFPLAAHAQAVSAQPATQPVPVGQVGAQSPSQYGIYGTPVASMFAPISDRIISDPLFLPLRGQIYGYTTYTFSNPTADHYNGRDVETNNTSGNDNLFTQYFAYGITDQLSVHVSMGYGFDTGDTTVLSTGVTSAGASNGWTDPTFGVAYRVFDQAKHSPVDVDLAASYAPNLIADHATGGGHLGTIAAGRDNTAMSVTVGREMKVFTIAGVGTATYHGVQYYEALATGDNIKAGSYWDYNLGVNTETRFTNRISANLGLGYDVAGSKNSSVNETTAGYSEIANPNYFYVNTALNYHIIPNRLVGALTYSYEDYTDSSTDVADPLHNSEERNHNQNVVGARLQYLFN